MVAYTPRHALPYPTTGDPLSTVDDTLKSLAESVDVKLDIRRHDTTGLKYARNLAYYEEGSPNLGGWVVIQTNMTMTNVMTRFDVRGYMYFAYNNIIDLSITAYAFQADNTYYNFEVNNKGSANFTEIRLLTRTSDGKLAIAFIPDTPSQYWHYPKVAVDAYLGHTEQTQAEIDGWTITRQANLNSYTTKRTITQQYWTYATLGNGWVNYNAGYANARYRKYNGKVIIQGLIANGSINSIAFTLPEGYRPNNGTLIFGTFGSAGGQRIDVDTAGNVVVSGGSNGFVSLSGIEFSVER